jgi:hypothetical protein
VENGESIKSSLDSLRNRLFNNLKFTDIDWYGAPLYFLSFFAVLQAEKCQMEQGVVVCILTGKSHKAQEIQMNLTCMYEDEVLKISAIKKWQTHFLERITT